MKVSIVIPNWNGEEKLKKHLPGVFKVARAIGVHEVIVSDDASTDGSVNLLKSEFPEVVLVERKINGGFSSNVNEGVKRCTGDIFLLLNTDAGIDHDVFEFASPHFKNPEVFSVGCNTGGSWAKGEFRDGFFWHGQGQCKETHRTLWASGGSGIFRKKIWDELGGLDKLFNPFYEEDVDLGYRATKRGFINIWEPKAKVEHYKEVGVIAEHFSKDKVTKVAERNHLIFTWKNITSEKMINEHKVALAKRLIFHPKYWTIFLAAVKKLPQILAKRKIEEKQAKLSDEEIFSLFANNRSS